jgi:hypothetical protein
VRVWIGQTDVEEVAMIVWIIIVVLAVIGLFALLRGRV